MKFSHNQFTRIFIVLFFTTFGIFIWYNGNRQDEEFKKLNFKGVVEGKISIEMGAHQYIINGDKIYFYSYDHTFNPYVDIGDSIVKNEGEERIIIFKNGSNKRIEIDL